MNKSKIQAILYQFNTCITFKMFNKKVEVYYIIDTYYIHTSTFQTERTTLKYILTCLNSINTTNIKIEALEGYGEYNQNNLSI